jgi:uncharacterized protein (TIGR02466 family)
MDNIKELNHLFITPVAKIQFDKYHNWQKYADLVYNTLTSENIESMYKIGVTPTPDDLHSREEFLELVKIIDRESREYFKLELGLDEEDLYLSCMWANVQIDGCRHHSHIHPNSFFSGVIYLELPEGPDVDPGILFFVDPRPGKLMQQADYKKHNVLSDRSYGFKPQLGMMLLFPSWLEHGTDVCRIGLGKKRVSVSFNYVLTRSSGETMKINHRPI